MTKNHLGSIYLALAATIWGGMYVVSKVVLTVIQPLELVWLRYVVALITLCLIGVATHQSWHIHRRDFGNIIAIGVIGYAISIWTQFVGTKLSSAQMGAMITSSTPAFMVIFARFILKEKITFRKGLSTIIAMIGVLCIVGVGDIGKANQLGGIVLGIAALTWALMSVLVKRIPSGYSQLVVTTYAIAIATVVITPVVFSQINQTQILALSQPTIWGGVLYLGIVATAAAFFLWNKGLQMVDAASGGLFFFFQPIAGTLLAWFFLGEQVGLSFWIGAVLIFSGVFLVVKEP
ncbi:DMT family transporter [Desulfosporosinus metallidurans]|uniref:Permease of the drug/metabolite transporter (DMT) superfamily n=1 Tax=Desulfosporosinus metallidurans TaxID=1888891 RepID=A0A1Q8QUZ3_9FIRM|nr:DMT family transporter [Desulfosporosinus metallidurans]OLN31156.1 Permease of the drug/metabolite transporter (DMT) superfamily [Desulfosporosinus metallidurans]